MKTRKRLLDEAKELERSATDYRLYVANPHQPGAELEEKVHNLYESALTLRIEAYTLR